MIYNVRITFQAQKDIDDIFNYISSSLCAPDSAKKLIGKFISLFGQLKEFPYSGTELCIPQSKFVYRWKLVESYLVFYVVDEEQNTVFLMRILYAARNYVSLLLNTEADSVIPSSLPDEDK